MSWNYRVVELAGEACGRGFTYYEIREVYYDEKDRIERWTVDPMSPGGETIEDLKWDLDHMLEALNRPILVLEDDKLREK